MVLVAGPYRSGTNGEPAKMAANVDAMNRAALDVFRAGHLPVTGEALALPLIDLTGFPKLPETDWDVGLTAVIEDADGGIAYWALAHPGEQPDFHHPASFTLRLGIGD